MKTKYKILIALSLAVVFGLGVAAGVLGERYFVHKNYRRQEPDRQHAPSLDSWAKELGLTAEQQAQIKEIFKKNEERMRTYRSEGLAKLAQIRKMLRAEIDAVFTPEQKKKNDEIIRQHELRRKTDPNRTNPNRDDSRQRREQEPSAPERSR